MIKFCSALEEEYGTFTSKASSLPSQLPTARTLPKLLLPTMAVIAFRF